MTNPVIYEVYPRSFLDTTGSGEGDLRGVIERLGYIRDLGVDGIWLAPFYASPMVDGGYDIVDHRSIDPRFGTLCDFDELIGKAEEMDLAVLVDMVFNHTSDQHPWFVAALNGDEEAAECYVWRNAKADGSPPNNWQSFIGPPAWTWSPHRGQYYFHQYLRNQPCLNLRNQKVQDDLETTIRFWRDRGVRGFRFDVVTAYLFDESLADNPAAPKDVRAKIEGPDKRPYSYQDHKYDLLPGDGADYAEKLRKWAGADAWLVGECSTGNKSLEIAQEFSTDGRLDAVYTTDIVECASNPAIYQTIFDALDGNWCLPWWFSSHDQARAATQHGQGDPDRTARFLAAILCVMPGPLMLFQGEELGLPQPHLDEEDIRDPFDKYFWPDPPGRSGPRVPIPWVETQPGFGFTAGRPWMPMRWPRDLSVQAQSDGRPSVLAFYREMLALRRTAGFASPSSIRADHDANKLTLRLASNDADYLAVFNFGTEDVPYGTTGEVLLATGAEGSTLSALGAIITRQ